MAMISASVDEWCLKRARARPADRVFAAVMMIAIAMNSHAEDTAPKRLPTVVVVAEPDRPACGKDQDAANVSYDCLNSELAALVTRQGHQQNVQRMAVSSATPNTPTGQGLYNQTATRIRMGNTFGRSVYPQRPPARTAPSPPIR